MSADRLAQARAEAERRWPLYPEDDQDDQDHTNAMRFVFMQGAEWERERADENPQPRRVTVGQMLALSKRIPFDEYEVTEILEALGIDVEDSGDV